MRCSQWIRRVLVVVAVTTLVAACAGDDTDDAAEETTTTTETTLPDPDEDDAATDRPAPEEPTATEPAGDSPPGTEVNENEGLDNPVVAVADLTSDQVVPGPGSADAVGRFELVADGDDEICIDLVLQNPPPGVNGAHVHVGAVGESGPIAIDLGLDALRLAADGGEARWTDVCLTVDADVVESLAVSTDAYYAQIHSGDHPEGAVRGQLQTASLFDLQLQ